MARTPVLPDLTDRQRVQIYNWIAAGKSNEWIMNRSFMVGRSPVILSGFRAALTRNPKLATVKPVAKTTTRSRVRRTPVATRTVANHRQNNAPASLTPRQRAQVYKWIAADKSNDFILGKYPHLSLQSLAAFRANHTMGRGVSA